MREAADRPIVGLGAGYTRTNHVVPFAFPGPGGLPRVLYPDVPNNYRTRLDLQWPIYSGGRTDALERAARAEASAAAADVAAAQADLRLEVARAFWALVTARATAAVLDRSLARAQANVGDVRERLNAGLVPPNEVASAEAQESRQRMLLIETRNQRDQSSAELARLIGEDVLQRIEPAADLELAGTATLPLDGLVADARATRDERRALEQRIAAAEEQVAAAEGSRRPVDRHHRRLRLRAAEPAHLSAHRPLGRVVGRGRLGHVGVLGRRPRPRRSGAGPHASSTPRASGWRSSTRCVALDVRQRLLDIDSGRAALAAADDAVRAATEARRVVANDTAPAWRSRPRCSTPTSRCCRRSSIGRARIAGVRFAEARLARALGQ